MKKIFVLLLLCALNGCTSTRAYLIDRGRDTCDMVTIAAEAPTVNASIQLGRAVIGIGAAGGRGFGLRSGAVGPYRTQEVNLVIIGIKQLHPRERDIDRDKGYDYSYMWLPRGYHDDSFPGIFQEGEWFNAWQFEAALGLGIGLRVGINLAEIADFILGWTTLDICADDIATMEKKEQNTFDNPSTAPEPVVAF